jgi:hypothetical protein
LRAERHETKVRPYIGLAKFGGVFARDGIELVAGELLWGYAGRAAGVAEEAVETGRGHSPQEEQLVIGIFKAVPGVWGDEENC